jgi:2-polyprenyl-3-methyl-5-hydroxy-6-metoxy-1,4-benzoquinol methylase
MSTISTRIVTLGPSASEQWLDAPDHLAMVLARYRAASALIGTSRTVLEVGCGEGIGARILARGRQYRGIDPDAAAIESANGSGFGVTFVQCAAEDLAGGSLFDAAVALDVVEHVPVERERRFMQAIAGALMADGVCVIGTPNAAFDHLASPQSKAEHVNTYTHARLLGLLARYFVVVQAFGMQDTALHLGHPDARHYLLMCGIGLR